MLPALRRAVEKEQVVVEQRMLTVTQQLVIDLSRCVGCGICVLSCPKEAITQGPVGAAVKRAAPVPPIVVDESKCSFCGVCVAMCPFGAIKLFINGEPKVPIIEEEGFPKLFKSIEIDKDECTVCGLCVDVCLRDALTRVLYMPQVRSDAAARVRLVAESIKFEVDYDKCTFCTLCSSICEAIEVVKEFSSEEGLVGKHVLFDEEKCTFCRTCEMICPEGAIKIELATRDKPWVGEIVRNLDECIACSRCVVACPKDAIRVEKPFEGEIVFNADKCPGECSTCVEVCPCGAIYLPQPTKPGEKVPRIAVNQDLCMLCGACVSACPVEGAIELRRKAVRCEGPETDLWKEVVEKLTKPLVSRRLG